MSKVDIWAASDSSLILYTEDYKLIKEVLPAAHRKPGDVTTYEKNGKTVAWQIEFDKKYLAAVKIVVKDYEKQQEAS